jgi:hypothetical protein
MIDLNLKPKSEPEEPLGIVILGSLPFVLMIVWGVLHAL